MCFFLLFLSSCLFLCFCVPFSSFYVLLHTVCAFPYICYYIIFSLRLLSLFVSVLYCLLLSLFRMNKCQYHAGRLWQIILPWNLWDPLSLFLSFYIYMNETLLNMHCCQYFFSLIWILSKNSDNILTHYVISFHYKCHVVIKKSTFKIPKFKRTDQVICKMTDCTLKTASLLPTLNHLTLPPYET